MAKDREFMSNRQKKLLRKQFLPQRRGRPLEAGPRSPSGKLKPKPADPVAPNEAVLKLRIILGGSSSPEAIRAAENPLDLAKYRGWIDPKQYAAGRWFVEQIHRSGLDLPRLRPADIERASRGFDDRLGDARAMANLRACAQMLRGWPKATDALFEVCVLEAFPRWMLTGATGHTNGAYLVGRNHLVYGLNVAATVLDGRSEAVQLPILRLAVL